MSNSSDGRRGARPPPPRPPPPAEPETRADRRYPVDGWRQPPAGEPWPDPSPDATWHEAHLRAGLDPSQRQGPPDDGFGGQDRDPRTGPPTFEFQPSPLQPRGAARISAATPVSPGDARARRPLRPEERREGAPDLGDLQPDAGQLEGAPRRETDRTVLSAPTRMQRSNREMANAPIVPAGSVTGRSLTLVVAIMCFLACLTAGAVYLMNQSATAWLHDIASEITVQVEVREKVDIDQEVADVAAFLGHEAGITAAKPLSLETSASLLEPWLGQTDALKNLPVPRLIAVEIDRANPPDFNALRARLTAKFKDTALDDHRHWQRQIRTVTRSFALGGLAILLLVCAATTAIIVSATRSALASNREIVEVLHFVGATDRFIARQFQRHFLWLGIRAGIFGATLAGLAFLGVPVAMEFLGGGSASVVELQQLVGTGALDLIGYAWLGGVVVVVAALCMFTSRIGVYRILHGQH